MSARSTKRLNAAGKLIGNNNGVPKAWGGRWVRKQYHRSARRYNKALLAGHSVRDSSVSKWRGEVGFWD